MGAVTNPKPSKPIKQELNHGYTINNTFEACELRYYKVSISISVQSEHGIHVNMWQSTTKHTSE